jgi:hypothetical protein
MGRYAGGAQTADVYGPAFWRLRSKLLKCGYELSSVSRNLRRCSHFNDEEAWEGRAAGPEGDIPLFSWQSVTDLLRAGPLEVTRDGPDHLARWEVTREDV